MSILDKLITLGFAEDLTETSWWTETVFLKLSEAESDLQEFGLAGIAEVDGSPEG